MESVKTALVCNSNNIQLPVILPIPCQNTWFAFFLTRRCKLLFLALDWPRDVEHICIFIMTPLRPVRYNLALFNLIRPYLGVQVLPFAGQSLRSACDVPRTANLGSRSDGRASSYRPQAINPNPSRHWPWAKAEICKSWNCLVVGIKERGSVTIDTGRTDNV